jgi:hypothetical protein
VKKITLIIIGSLIFLLLVFLILSSAKSGDTDTEDLDLTKQSFSYKDKKPGGCYVFYKVLSEFYSSDIKPLIVTKPFASTYKKDKDLGSGYNLYVLVAKNLYATKQDVNDMISYATAGNQLFLAVSNPDSMLLAQLHLTVELDSAYAYYKGSEQHYVNPLLAPDTLFQRNGIPGGRYFTSLDTPKTTILGTDYQNRPNFIKINVGNGSVVFSLQPSAVTNYFLMHEKNITSLEHELSYSNYYQDHVYWDEFYKYQDYRQSDSDFSEWQVLMRYPAMRWAIWLAVILLVVYILFEGKRRQRIIPEKPVLSNNSMEFVNALGQLYYHQHDNGNLGRKIVQQWLEFIRTRYYLNTSYLNDAFSNTLAHKSGIPLETVRSILNSIHHIQLSDEVSDEELKRFYKNIQAFYLNTK